MRFKIYDTKRHDSRQDIRFGGSSGINLSRIDVSALWNHILQHKFPNKRESE